MGQECMGVSFKVVTFQTAGHQRLVLYTRLQAVFLVLPYDGCQQVQKVAEDGLMLSGRDTVCKGLLVCVLDGHGQCIA